MGQTKTLVAPILEPITQAFIDNLEKADGKPLYELSYADARQVLETVQSMPVDMPAAVIEDKTLPVGPTGQVPVTIYRPENSTGVLPVVMYFHGGGWILGSQRTHERLLRDLVSRVQAAFVFVNYTPSPEAQFPVPIEEAYEATRYIAEHAAEMNLDSTRLAVVGDSVGGNMAAVVALLSKERKSPQICYQVLLYPVTDADCLTTSYQEFAEGPWLTKAAMEWFWDAYAPNKEDRKKISASPLKASIEQLKDLPPGLIIVDENDVLRDEGEAYARKLIQAGVEISVTRILATHHDFLLLNPLAQTPATKMGIELIADKLNQALM